MGIERKVFWSPLFDGLEAMVSNSSPIQTIIAPFIQSDALSHFLERIPIADDLRVLTRWNPGDIGAGVSDPEAFVVLRNFNVPLYHSPEVHSKIYLQTDGNALVGSGNLTKTGLGIEPASFFQYETGAYVKLSAIDLAMIDFIFSRSILIDEERYLNAKTHQGSELIAPSNEQVNCELRLEEIPLTESPDSLWKIYYRITSSGKINDSDRAGWLDILSLQLPLNISNRAKFEEQLKCRLLCQPLVQRIVSYIEEYTPIGKAAHNPSYLGVQNGAIRQFVSAQISNERRSIAERVNNLQNWLPFCKPEIAIAISVPGKGNSHVFTWIAQQDA